jgi:Mor family transcriptional regulator
MREMLSAHADLARKLDNMEKKYDVQFKTVFNTIRQLMRPPQTSQRQIGFHAKQEP